MQTNKPYRVSHRLRGFDYSLPEAYFVTICTCQKKYLFGTVHSGKMQLHRFGEIAFEEWLKTPGLRPKTRLGDFEVMPNHIHGIIILEEGNCTQESSALQRPTGDLPVAPTGPRQGSLGAVIGNFKGAVTRRIRQRLNRPYCAVITIILSGITMIGSASRLTYWITR